MTLPLFGAQGIVPWSLRTTKPILSCSPNSQEARTRRGSSNEKGTTNEQTTDRSTPPISGYGLSSRRPRSIKDSQQTSPLSETARLRSVRDDQQTDSSPLPRPIHPAVVPAKNPPSAALQQRRPVDRSPLAGQQGPRGIMDASEPA